MALIIQYFVPPKGAPNNYGCAPGSLSIHKCINLALLPVRDAGLHRPAG